MLQAMEAVVTRRRPGRPLFQGRTLDDLRAANGAPLRLRELRQITGFSRPKIMADIRLGYLSAYPVKCGTDSMWMVSFGEAQRYLRALHFL